MQRIPAAAISDYAALVAAIERRGLAARGAFAPRPEDGVPQPEPGHAAGALVMVGITPQRGWRAFRACRHRGEGPHPLDDFSREVLGALALELGGRALFPFDGPPWLPFQRWAQRCEDCHPSPLGLLIHPRHGLWHGYRGALAFARALAGVPQPAPRPSPCAGCASRPCLDACPVGAFGREGLDAARCRAHLDSAAGERCLTAGCLARAACPVAPADSYPAQQRRFHLLAFRDAARPR